jgi:histidine triad (HIT) family protein
VTDPTLPVVDLRLFCSVPKAQIWIDAEHAIAFAADEPVADGHIVIVPKGHIPSVHALQGEAQKGVWALVSDVSGRLRTGLVPDAGFSIGFVDGLTTAEPVPHTVIHVVPRRAGDQVALPDCSGWIHDDGVLP